VMFRGSKTAMKITTKAPNKADFRRAPELWSKGRDEVVSVPLLSTMKNKTDGPSPARRSREWG
jgi:hypothetical protein